MWVGMNSTLKTWYKRPRYREFTLNFAWRFEYTQKYSYNENTDLTYFGFRMKKLYGKIIEGIIYPRT